MRFQDQLDAMIAQLPPQAAAREAARAAQLVAHGGTSLAAVCQIASDAAHDLDLRLFAAWVLGRVEDPGGSAGGKAGAEATLIALLAQGPPQLRAQAAQSLGNFSGQASAEALGKALHDENRDVRKLAAHALGWLGSDTAVTLLIATLDDRRESEEVRGMAAEALGNTGDARAVEPLIRALGDASAEVRFWAASALAEVGDERALPGLNQVAGDVTGIPGYGTVGAEAREAIAQIRARQAGDERHTL